MAVAWSHASQKHIDVLQPTLRLVNRDTFTFTMHGGTLQCYCACRVPYDPTHWVLTLAPAILPSHTPWHAVPFRFPFQLPLYPEGDVVFVRVTLLQDADADADDTSLRPFYLSSVPPRPIGVLMPLSVEAWLESEPAWRQAIEAAGDTPAFLSAAFDNMWDCTVTPDAVLADDDAFLSTDAIEDPDCDSDVIALHTALFAAAPIGGSMNSIGSGGGGGGGGGCGNGNKHAGTHDAAGGSGASGCVLQTDDVCSVAVTEDACLDDDDEAAQIDIHTGLVATDAACMDDQDDELESIDGDTDDEEDDEEDDEDEEDDDDVTE